MTEKSGLELLRVPFPANQISKLPKPTRKDAPKGKCTECGGWHGLPAIHLDYVGHAALTDRLLDTDPAWGWEPLSLGPEGLPVLDPFGGMWIRLTVLGVTRLGYGHAGDKQGGDAIKEIIGDALRNAAMRFGAALELWHKGDLHAHVEDEIGNDGSEDTKAIDPINNNGNFGLRPARYAVIRSVANAALQRFNEGDDVGAYGEASGITDTEEKLALWSILKPHSALRSMLKRLGEEERAAQKKLEEQRSLGSK